MDLLRNRYGTGNPDRDHATVDGSQTPLIHLVAIRSWETNCIYVSTHPTSHYLVSLLLYSISFIQTPTFIWRSIFLYPPSCSTAYPCLTSLHSPSFNPSFHKEFRCLFSLPVFDSCFSSNYLETVCLVLRHYR